MGTVLWSGVSAVHLFTSPFTCKRVCIRFGGGGGGGVFFVLVVEMLVSTSVGFAGCRWAAKVAAE